METQVTTCRSCGFPVASGARFCQNCGLDVSVEQGMVPTMSVAALPPRKTSSEVALELLREETLGEYEILGELGRGGMATVFLAHHIALDRKVAIKVMAPALFDEGLAERFRREARTAAALNHPHIIPIYGVYERSALLYFVMKFVAGQSLDPILHALGQMPVAIARVVLAQAASALGYAHRRGVVHRDVKPANIMVDDEGWVVMTDFGIAKVPTATGLTLTGVTVGTPAYMSPEQCLGKDVTGASDQYSLGVVAYELLTGQKPFVAANAMAMMYAHFNEEPRPLRELKPDIPEDLERSVLRMLAKSPEDRWPRIDDAFGSPVLAHDDPVRERLIDLAKASPNAAFAASLTSPTSPIPPARRTSARVTAAPGTTTPVAPAITRETHPAQPAPPPATAGPAAAPPTAPPAVPPAEGARLTPTSATVPLPAAGPQVSEPVIPAPAAASAPPAEPAPAPAQATGAAPTASPARPSVTAAPARRTAPLPRQPQKSGFRVSPLWAGIGVVVVVAAGLLLRNGPEAAPAGAATTGDTVHPGGTLPAVSSNPPADSARPAGTDSATPRPAPPPPVTPAPIGVARVQLQPARATLEIGKTLRLTPTLLGAGGVAISDQREVRWQSSAPAVASVTDAGVVTANRAGQASITATVEGKKASVAITVPAAGAPPPPPLASMTIQPDTLTLVVGRQANLNLQLRDVRGAALDRLVDWRVSPENIVELSGSGSVIGRSPGVARVVAQADGKSASALVTVIAEPVTGVSLTPATAALKPGETVQLTATALGAGGRALDGRSVVWSSSDSEVASVADGKVTARKAGSAQITATIESQRRSMEVTVTAPAAPPPAVATVNPAEEQRRASAEATRLLEAFVTALNSRDVERVKAAYPGMTQTEEARWRATLENRSVTRVRATLQQTGQLTLSGDTAEVPARIKLVVTVAGLDQPNEQGYRATISREGGGPWRLMRLDAR